MAVSYYREKEFYVRVALTLENPELFQVLSWTPGQKLTHPSAKTVQELRFLSIKIQQSGLQPIEYLTRGLAGAMLPEGRVDPQIAAEYEQLSQSVLVRSGIHYKLPEGSLFTGQVVARASKGMRASVAHILYMVCCFIVGGVGGHFCR